MQEELICLVKVYSSEYNSLLQNKRVLQ